MSTPGSDNNSRGGHWYATVVVGPSIVLVVEGGGVAIGQFEETLFFGGGVVTRLIGREIPSLMGRFCDPG